MTISSDKKSSPKDKKITQETSSAEVSNQAENTPIQNTNVPKNSDKTNISLLIAILLPLSIFAILIVTVLILVGNNRSQNPKTVSSSSSTSSQRSLSSGNCKYNREVTPPANKFVAHYFDGDTYVCSEIVESIQKSYSWSEFENIKSENFRAEYEGSLYFDEETYKILNIDLSWSKIKIEINDSVVVDFSNDTKEAGYNFKKGENKVKVNYENNWHTVGYAVSFDDPVTKVDLQEAKTNAPDLGKGEIFLIGAYEAEENYKMDLYIENSSQQIDLILTSYRKVQWNIVGPGKDRVKNVLIYSYSAGSKVTGDQQPKYRIQHLNKITNNNGNDFTYKLLPSCRKEDRSDPKNKNQPMIYCENPGSLSQLLEIGKVLGKKPTGFSGEYSPSKLVVPDVKLDDKAYTKLEQDTKRIRTEGESQQQKPNDCITVGEDIICGGEGEDLIIL